MKRASETKDAKAKRLKVKDMRARIAELEKTVSLQEQKIDRYRDVITETKGDVFEWCKGCEDEYLEEDVNKGECAGDDCSKTYQLCNECYYGNKFEEKYRFVHRSGYYTVFCLACAAKEKK
jgi:hypothetical protein